MFRFKTKTGLLPAVVAVVALFALSSIAHAYCVSTQATPWSSSATKTLGANTTIPVAIRTAIGDALGRWNMTGSELVFAAPVFTTSWSVYNFRANWLSLTPLGYPPYVPAVASGANVSPSHSGGYLMLSSDWTWVTNGMHDLNTFTADTATVVVHETGHFNGLSHPTTCTMSPSTAEQLAVMTVITSGQRWFPNSDDKAYQTVWY